MKEGMKTPERFNKALKALTQAFFDDTLVKGYCMGCAVGNIIANANGHKVYKDGNRLLCDIYNWSWKYHFFTDAYGIQIKNQNNIYGLRDLDYQHAITLMKETGYSVDELAKIEYAFETSTEINFKDYKHYSDKKIYQDQFNGLMAVVDVLCEIEGLESTEYKKYFEYTEGKKVVNEFDLFVA